ncbi:MAG: aspartate carbamoyltransferase [Oscillospiraceae bacterium]|nr:aspartate carbamoyltransferase [Oscillospiraceae bacterium]
MNLQARNLINTLDLSLDEQAQLLTMAADMMCDSSRYTHCLDATVMASLFFEPSTRTRLSFEAAMQRLGGSVIGFSEAASSSVSKGESLSDTIIMAGQYADVIVMRSPKEGAPLVAAGVSDVPVINAGDGGREHPTQTLTDLMTIQQRLGRLDNLTIGCCGDLKFGRTVHSLVKNLGRYPNVKFVFVSPDELTVPQYLRDYLQENGIPFVETADLVQSMPELDILYMTRVQRERFFNEEEYIRLKDRYILDIAKLKTARENMAILHPLPRVNEIAVVIDSDPRAAYFEQVKNGMYVRMALLASILGRQF